MSATRQIAGIQNRALRAPVPEQEHRSKDFGSDSRTQTGEGGNDAPFDVDRFLGIAGDTSIAKYRGSECVFAQGDPADSVFYVRHGAVKLTVVSDRGKEATIGMLEHGEFCGEGCLIDEQRRRLTATAMGAGTILRIPKKSALKLLHGHADFSAYFTSFLIGRTLRIQQDLIDQRFHPSEIRLARLLLTLSNSAARPDERPLLPRISQEMLASMVGTTRSRISFFLNKFKKAGLIEYSRGIRVNPGLAELVQGH